MTFEISIVLVIILITVVLFATELLPIEITALVSLGLLLLTGVLEPAQAFTGFSNPAVITIALLFALSHALQKTGVLEYFVNFLNKLARHSTSLGLIVFLFSIAILSAFINNTAVVAIFIPIAIQMAQKYSISPSKILIPLSYAAIMGGTLTLIGTSTNLLVNSIMITSTGEPALGMFEFTRYGIVILLVGMIYLTFIGYRMLPSRTVTGSLTQNYHMGSYLTEIKITPESTLAGKTCLDRAISQNYDVVVLDILRDNERLSTNIRDTKLLPGDILFVRGAVENLLRLKKVEKVMLLTDEKLTHFELTQLDNVLVESLLTDQSDLVGRSVMEINFRRHFGSFVLAIRREGAILRSKIAHIVLKAYDTLLVYGPREKIQEMASTGDFIVLQEIEAKLRRHRFWWLSIIVLLGVVSLAAIGISPIITNALLAVIILLVVRVITPNEVYHSIHWPVIILIASLIPLGIAIQTSGTADWIGGNISNLISNIPDSMKGYILLGVLYLITAILTEFSSNAAAAIIMVPIAVNAAAQIGLMPRPFILAICFAASASFATPVGYQTNLMVYGPGGYKFTDYLKIGIPLAFILWITATLLIPVLWPFTPV
ncbi:MAG: SLC13 family permease [Candidatus Marinimicrobia bacterium]|nr:SLC13 family permease [Candidatus Neomarinimicrobiota bacterium]